MATGDLVMFVGPNDRAGNIERLLASMHQYHSDIACATYYRQDENGTYATFTSTTMIQRKRNWRALYSPRSGFSGNWYALNITEDWRCFNKSLSSSSSKRDVP